MIRGGISSIFSTSTCLPCIADKVRIRASNVGDGISQLAGIDIRSTQFARIYCNHELVIGEAASETRGNVYTLPIQNGQIAALILTISSGVTLELT